MNWIEDGLCFSCTQCGNCCKGEGHVWVDTEEIRAMADALEMNVDDFSRKYVRQVGRRYSLTETGSEYRCVLLGDDDRCTVYEDRPLQCRTFPFWPEAVATLETWEELKSYCPGVDSGRQYSKSEIREILAKHGDADGGSPSS